MLGQSENRGVIAPESYSKDSKTLWRMEVEGPRENGTYKVGFYGECMPLDARGEGMYFKVPGLAGPRALKDTRVAQQPTPDDLVFDKWFRDEGLKPVN